MAKINADEFFLCIGYVTVCGNVSKLLRVSEYALSISSVVVTGADGQTVVMSESSAATNVISGDGDNGGPVELIQLSSLSDMSGMFCKRSLNYQFRVVLPMSC